MSCQYEASRSCDSDRPLTKQQALEWRVKDQHERMKGLKISVENTTVKINDLNTELENLKMNLTTHTVKKVTSEPYFKYLWCVDVVADSWGNESPTTVYCQTEEEAKQVKPGYKYEA